MADHHGDTSVSKPVAGADKPLHESVQELLPPELVEMIYDFTFAITTAKFSKLAIDKNYKPPFYLQVSKGFREKFSDAFYGKTEFTFTAVQLMPKWVDALPLEVHPKLQMLVYSTEAHGFMMRDRLPHEDTRVAEEVTKDYRLCRITILRTRSGDSCTYWPKSTVVSRPRLT